MYKLTYPQTRWIFTQIISAVRYLHDNCLVHQDLKLDNILVFEKDSQIKIKIADFGMA